MNDYPFSAIVGQEDMLLALILNGINPNIRGVLISGVKGSGKSCAARGLANLLPDIRVIRDSHYNSNPDDPYEETSETATDEVPTPFVSLPIGATEDRVLGTIDLEKAIRLGEKRFEPGLLARVHRGVLYIDEVNLLPDHLVDILLDVAVSGVNVVEREGVSVRHPARFILIGTMNPEEGELRPQLLDRFGMSVQVENLSDPAQRTEIVRRTIAFEADPEAFARTWANEETRLRERILRARDMMGGVRIPEEITEEVSAICCREHVEGLRADIVIQKGAMTLAAWEGRQTVNRDDVERIAEFALAHRRKNPPDPPPPSPPRPPAPPRPKQQTEAPRSADPDASMRFDPLTEGPVRNPQTESRMKRRIVQPGGRSGWETAKAFRGPYVRARFPKGKVTDLALDATLRAAVIRPENGRTEDTAISIRSTDLREKIRRTPYQRLFLFVLDASRSMGARRRMEVTKGVLLGLLEEAYQKRDEVGLITFQGSEARVVLPPTRSVRRAQRSIRDLPVGGKTPLAHALHTARQVLAHSRRRHPAIAQSLVLVSDGRPTVGFGNLDPVRAAERELHHFSKSRVDLLLVDTEEGPFTMGMMQGWGSRWNIPVVTLEALRPKRIRQLLRAG